MFPKCFWVYFHFLESSHSTSHHATKENLLSLSQKLSIANRSSARAGASCLPAPFTLALSHMALNKAYDCTCTVVSCVQLPCVSRQRGCFYSSSTCGSFNLSVSSSAMISEPYEKSLLKCILYCLKLSYVIIIVMHLYASYRYH